MKNYEKREEEEKWKGKKGDGRGERKGIKNDGENFWNQLWPCFVTEVVLMHRVECTERSGILWSDCQSCQRAAYACVRVMALLALPCIYSYNWPLSRYRKGPFRHTLRLRAAALRWSKRFLCFYWRSAVQRTCEQAIILVHSTRTELNWPATSRPS